jgi:hypothetical protein
MSAGILRLGLPLLLLTFVSLEFSRTAAFDACTQSATLEDYAAGVLDDAALHGRTARRTVAVHGGSVG